MKKTLGLDLGTNSVGWAIRNTNEVDNQIIDKGVLIFEKGVGEEKGIEVPLVKKRTESRSKRRNYQAEKYRKWEMLKCLIESDPKMCPLTIDELDGWRKYDKATGRIYPQRKEFINWLKLDFNEDGKVDFENPYHLRKTVAEQKIDDPIILGRAFYHLVQRRGFRGRDEEEAKTIMEGSKETGTVGAEAIHRIMQEQNTTLGGALYYDLKNNGKRIRKRYNIRNDFEEELKKICLVQGIDENSELFKKLYKAVIWQRPLRTQKGNVGRCTLEPSKRRCPVSHPLYEEYRAWCFINNIKIKANYDTESNFEPLTAEQRKNIYEKLFFRKSKTHFKFAEIIKLIDPKQNTYEFNFKEYISVSGCPTITSMKELFGQLDVIKIPHAVNEKRNQKKNFYNYEDIWHVLFLFNSKEKIADFGKLQLGLDEERVEKFCKIKLCNGYASLSICAINKILPYLRKGYIYSDAVYLANIKKVLARETTDEELNRIVEGIRFQIKFHKEEKDLIGLANNLIAKHLNLEPHERFGRYPEYILQQKDYDDIEKEIVNTIGSKTWNGKEEGIKNRFRKKITDMYQAYLQAPISRDKSLLFNEIPRLDERIKTYLINEWGACNENLKHLYHPSETENYPPAKEKGGKKYLGDPMPISRGFKNPMAMKTLHNLKRLLNYMLEQGKIDETTRIVIEIARELNDSNKRKAIERWQREREKQNKEYYESIKEIAEKHGLNIDPNNDEIIDKYRLWIEQERQCIYTGKVINCAELFDGTKFDIEHTIPADLSFDNELKNLTIADSWFNREVKQKRIPTELLNYNNNTTIGNELYTAIAPRLEFMEKKVDHFENQIEFWKKESKKASIKDRKDFCIQQRHYNQFELDYWKKKLDTFTIKEYKSTWRNSQLRDTQIITKYALPYLKTVFNKVDVQKGTITAEFRKIFNVGFEKDRTKHTHHAVDAAILTLVPSAVKRDKLLKEHFAAMENNISFHSMPSEWNNYTPQYLMNIEGETLVNYISQDRTMVPTKKYVRKRGLIQYAKEKLNGKWTYKRDEQGNKIPLITQGDSVRGQLHKETFYGVINENDKSVEDENLVYVEHVLLKDFSSEKDFKNIIDPVVKRVLSETIKERMETGKSFKEAIAEDIWMVDKTGKPKMKDKQGNILQPIRHVRCKVAAGRGYLTKALPIKEHIFLSKHEYKQHYYAQNEINYLYLLYEFSKDDEITKTHRIINLFEAKQLGIKKDNELFELPGFRSLTKGRGANERVYELKHIIKTGMHVLLWKESEDELRDLGKKDLLKRLYRVYKFNEISTAGLIYLQYHKEARRDKELGEGNNIFSPGTEQARLRFTANNFNGLIAGKDFHIKLDGEIVLK
jgi:CRISPR-associated endonuclease Csn1